MAACDLLVKLFVLCCCSYTIQGATLKGFKQHSNGLVLRFEKTPDDGNCQCSGLSCSCCQSLKIKQLHFNKPVCLNLTYLKEEIGIEITVTVDSKVVITKNISAKNPPPVCTKIKLLKEKVNVCIQFYDLKTTTSGVSGCARVTAKMSFLPEVKVNLGCFDILKLNVGLKDIISNSSIHNGFVDKMTSQVVHSSVNGFAGKLSTPFDHRQFRITELIVVWRRRISSEK